MYEQIAFSPVAVVTSEGSYTDSRGINTMRTLQEQGASVSLEITIESKPESVYLVNGATRRHQG